MRLFLKCVFAAILAIASSITAFGAEIRKVPANQASAIFFYYTYNYDTCGYGGKSKFMVGRQPEHGTLTAIWTGYKMGKEGRRCTGKLMKGMLVIYKPVPGYHGPDKAGFAFSSSESGYHLGKSYRVDIAVN